MKKVVLLALVAFLTIGCSNMNASNKRTSVATDMVMTAQVNASLRVGGIIQGKARCENWFFGLFKNAPVNQTYGSIISSHDVITLPNVCVRGALYNALKENKAEYILDPKYDVQTKNSGCIGSFCFHQVIDITVTGYKANIQDFKNVIK